MTVAFPLNDEPWIDQALCAQTDPEAFFPEKGGSGTRNARKVCLGCDVRGECLEYALEHDERFGVWGGLSERERRKLKCDIRCSDCGDAFTSDSNRDRHIILRHNPVNPHVCATCKQTFSLPKRLKGHQAQAHRAAS
jgi:WhiB family transcriptional regulator, redox-sensing transcriptional regulator